MTINKYNNNLQTTISGWLLDLHGTNGHLAGQVLQVYLWKNADSDAGNHFS